jgi:hypothetical protein
MLRIVAALALLIGFTADASAAGLAAHASSIGTDTSSIIAWRAPAWAVCDPSGSDCPGLYPYTIKMNVFANWDLRVPLPAGFLLTNHNWTMTHDAADLSIRQAIVGGTLRMQGRDRWVELGVGVAEQSRVRPELDLGAEYSGADAGGNVGRIGAALLAGVGGWIQLNPHIELDLRLRGGLGVGELASHVYHCNFVIAFNWR